ncbi:hypothetical protein [Chryseolinea serpens]|uniref:hypothetical protein n=1 Tax=Chryseolinea serpens TaxID=947013 RepID=UPI001C8893D7|nr:hypothetical protein [Chryseolinea serpens]
MSTLIDVSAVEKRADDFLETPAAPRKHWSANASGRSVINDKHVACAFPVATYGYGF